MSCLRVKCTLICICGGRKDGETHVGCTHDTVPLGRFTSQAGIRLDCCSVRWLTTMGRSGQEKAESLFVGRMAHQDPDPSAFLPNSLLLPFHFPTTI
jgi:hypothetical protein